MNESSVTTVAAVIKELATGNIAAIPGFFTGMSEPKRSAFRKEYLENFSLYGTVHTITAPLSEIQQNPLAMFQTDRRNFVGAILLDLAVGNRSEILYALRPAVMRFPEHVLPILRDRDISKFVPAITRDLLANRSESLPAWSMLVDAGLIEMTWDDRTITMICDSESPSDFVFLRELVARSPKWSEVVYHMCGVENWLVIATVNGSRAALDLIDGLMQSGRLDRMRMLQSALAGMYLVKNQNQSRACELIFDFVAPTIDELAACQADLCSVLNFGKPIVFTFCLQKLDQLSSQQRADWPMVAPCIGAAFSRAGIAQSKDAIRLLKSALTDSPHVECLCQALTQALLHSKREITELAWKALLPALPQASTTVLQELEQASQHVQGTLAKTIADYLASLGKPSNNADSRGANDSSIAEYATADTAHTDWAELLEQLQSLPLVVRSTLRCQQAFTAAYQGKLANSFDWGMQNSMVLPDCDKLQPIQTMDELIMRIGRIAHSSENDFEEPALILDGICRLPRSTDDQFESKTAALRKNALSNTPEGLANGYDFPDYTLVILNWLGQPPAHLDRYVRRRSEELADFLIIATTEWVKAGRSFQLLSTPTHRGGWLDPHVLLERLEAAERLQAEVLFEDLELALLRLAPDGRTTPIRDAALVDRARKLSGDHTTVVRYAMGDRIAWEEMTGSKRLWLAAIRGRDPMASIPEQAAFAKSVTDPVVLKPANWKIEFTHDIGDTVRPRVCHLYLAGGGELRNWHTKQPASTAATFSWSDSSIAAGAQAPGGETQPLSSMPVATDRPAFRVTAPYTDDIYYTRYLMSQALNSHLWPIARSTYPQQLDWYWNSLPALLIVQSTKKVDAIASDNHSPWLDSQRPLTYESARALWLASLTKGDVAKVWLQEVWAQLIAHDRLNTDLLVNTASELAGFQWCAVKRWSELLSQVAQRSDLHAWELARLSLGLLCTINFDPKDVTGLIETIHTAYASLHIAVTPDERTALDRYAAGKSKKLIDEIMAIIDKDNPQRTNAARQKLIVRLQRAQVWSHAIPTDRQVPASISEAQIAAEQIDLAALAVSKVTAAKETATGVSDDVAASAAVVTTVKASTAQSRNAIAKKKSQQPQAEVPLERSSAAMRQFRAALPALANYAHFQYYVGWAASYLDRELKHDCIDDQYLMLLLHHLGLPVVRTPWQLADLLQRKILGSAESLKNISPIHWLTTLASAFVTGNTETAKALLDRTDLNMETGYDGPSVNTVALVAMATAGLRSTPLNIPNSLKLQLESDKKLSQFVALCTHISSGDSAAFAKAFQASAKKVANNLNKALQAEEHWKLRWWSSALLCTLWHAAKHAGIDCSLIATPAMALVPSAATIGVATETTPSLTFPLANNSEQLSLQLLDQMLTSAGVAYALIRPRVDTNLIKPWTTEWTIVVDPRDESAWNRLFEEYDPQSCVLNSDLQFADIQSNNLTGYQAALLAMPQFGTLFRRLAVPDSLKAKILQSATRVEQHGVAVTLAPLEESIGVLMPLITSMANDARMLIGKSQNRAYFRAQLDKTVQWIVSLLPSDSSNFDWSRVESAAGQVKASAGVDLLKQVISRR